jgi:phenylalanyl-tRNA synthetase beta chain
MLISLKWIRDFVDLPADLDPRALAERFTRTTAEVDGVQPIQVRAKGLIAARVSRTTPIDQKTNWVTLDIGGGKTIETASIAADLGVGKTLVYATVGAYVAGLGDIRTARVAGKNSSGLILPGEAIGIEKAFQEAVFLSEEFKPGDALPADLFDDVVLEVDNKAITHRPDLWGHYGIAREIAAIVRRPLKPFPVVPLEELASKLPEIPIAIADPQACRRYTALVVEGVPTQPAPLWMQLRLGHVGQRPISGLVDLTNYVMLDLGQPMHAFDAAKVDRIEIDWAKEGERFKTLDGVERTLGRDDLMIKAGGRSVALAGVMGGLDTEVSESTTSLLLESANFDPAPVRRTAKKLGLRTEASARFEKSLDPAHTTLGIQRFLHLGKPMYPRLRINSRLSDGYPSPHKPVSVRVEPTRVTRALGRSMAVDETRQLLSPLGYAIALDGAAWRVDVPSFRATGDCSIEEDIIEELARCSGYDAVVPAMPRVTVRHFPPNPAQRLERGVVEYFTTACPFCEVYDYIWYDDNWLRQLGIDPGACVTLVNPAAEGMQCLRRSLMPGMFSALAKNRFHFPSVALVEVGSVFEKHPGADQEFRHMGLILADRGKRGEDTLFQRLKNAIAGWTWRQFGRSPSFAGIMSDPHRPWEQPNRTAGVVIESIDAGRLSILDVGLRRRIDEHLGNWSVAWAELTLSALEAVPVVPEPLAPLPPFPLVEMDFSILVPKKTRFTDVVGALHQFRHDLAKQIRFVTSYEGESIGKNLRSLTFRFVLRHDERTLDDSDLSAFKDAFVAHTKALGYELRTS